SLAGLRVLERCGIEASVALGHSLGEISALCWAGACDREDLLRIVSERGRIMAKLASPFGSMVSVQADCEEVKRRIKGNPLVIAAYNSPLHTVVSGDTNEVRQFAAHLISDGISATILPVSHAFHSPLMAKAADSFHDYLRGERFARLHRRVVSTVTGSVLEKTADLHRLLSNQITTPVRFADALAVATAEADFFVEVGPGAVLSGIAAIGTDKPVIALDVGGESLRGLLMTAGAAFASGARVRVSALFENRFVRPFDLKRRHTFLQNPCEANFHSLAVMQSVCPPAGCPTEISTGNEAENVLRNLIAQRTELPLAAIRPESRFLDDLHLNSITVSQIILQAAVQLKLPVSAPPTEYANVSIAEAAKALEGIRQTPSRAIERFPRGVDSWIRILGVEFVEQEIRATRSRAPGTWQVLATQAHALCASLQQLSRKVSGTGVICLVPAERDEKTAAFLLECIQLALKQNVQQMVFVGSGAAAMARTLYLEHPKLKVTVLDVPLEHPKAAEWIAQEAEAASGFTESHYDTAGTRREPRLNVLWPDKALSEIGLGPEDVLLVSGGGKGITAQCALALACESRCSLALLGRSDPARDKDLQNTLLCFTERSVRWRYLVADIADPDAIAKAIQQVQEEMGHITAVLHGAGINAPKRLEEITPADVHDTVAPKVTGLRNILNNINSEKLHLLVAFGSIIARTGLHGEGHYGLANDWMAGMVESWQKEHPACRCLNLEWSVWAGAGMGQQLGVLDSLMRQ